VIDTQRIPVTYRTLVFLALLIVIVIGIQITSYIINILLLSLVLTMLIYPCVRWLKEKGLPDIAAVSVITGGAVLIIIGLILLILASIGQLIADLPFFQVELQERLADIFMLFDRLGIERTAITSPTINLQSTAMIISQSMISLSEALLYIFFIAITTFFALLEAPKIPERIRKIYGSVENESLRQFARMSRFMVDFVVVRTETNNRPWVPLWRHPVCDGGALCHPLGNPDSDPRLHPLYRADHRRTTCDLLCMAPVWDLGCGGSGRSCHHPECRC